MLWPVPPSGANEIPVLLSLKRRPEKWQQQDLSQRTLKAQKDSWLPICTFSPAPQSREKGREKTNDFRGKVEVCHEPEVNLSWAELVLNSSQLSFALQGLLVPKPPALYPTFKQDPWGWGRWPGEGKTVRELTVRAFHGSGKRGHWELVKGRLCWGRPGKWGQDILQPDQA